ncbi:unnamed protein product [Rotaria magnacalcarata]|uniref:Uncharacterized protein n=1 Tax=Rotaria magnacalcarata TaxID=392030 RepID=A0A8S2M7Y7_9BILA|nr:unnamed protein product [Rotaria magnacalcarata]
MFNNHTLVDFDRVLLNDSKEINRLQNEFESNGWCFIRLPNGYDQLTNKLKEVQTVLSAFFAQSQEVKSRYESSNPIGYSHVGHKEGIKVLIDQNGLGNFHNRLTSDVEQALQHLAILIHNLANVLKTIIFNMSLFRQNASDRLVELSELGMLDIVNYFNKKAGPQQQPKIGLNTNEVNCVPHFDPGLFSLSGASVIMRNQPNSVPFEIKPNGETMNSFLKRVENERGLSISKSGIEHIEIKFPVRKNATSDQPKKKRSFWSKILK